MEGGEITFTFADAVAKYRKPISQENLADTYKRAGRSFRCLLQQNFVVLKNETEIGTAPPQGGSGARNWQKRDPWKTKVLFLSKKD
jgi:hypothetical protein